MKRNKKYFLTGFLTVFFTLALAACNAQPLISYEVTPSKGEIVDFHTELQAAYLADDYESVANYASASAELSRPNAVSLSWEGEESDGYVVELSVWSDFLNSKIYETDGPWLDIYNLYASTTYYWRVAPTEKQLKYAEKYTFTTSSAPRNLYVDGVTNVRDLGGWTTESGKRVKQGLLYRGGRMNTSYASTLTVELTETGWNTLVNDLGVKTEIDLRGYNQSEAGGMDNTAIAGVEYVYNGLTWDGNLLTANKAEIVRVFELLAQEETYPAYFHCDIGTDRTGMIAYLLNGVLGVPQEDLYRDYLYSNFGNIKCNKRYLNGTIRDYVDIIQKCAGNTYQEQVETCLLGIGVQQSTINSIRSILLED